MESQGSSHTVVLLVIDGLRPDAIDGDRMPALARLRDENWSASHAETVSPSITIAALASLATGVSPATHQLTEANLTGLGRLRDLTPLPAHLKRHRIPTRIVLGEMPGPKLLLARLLVGAAGVAGLVSAGDEPGTVGVRAATLVRREPGGLVVVYLDECDRAGHASGWMSPQYFEAAARCDAAVSHLATLAESGEATLCVTADHGGGGVEPTDHDLPHPVNSAIPIILAGHGLAARGSSDREAHLLDIPPTVAALLGAPVPVGYEGRILSEALGVTPIAA